MYKGGGIVVSFMIVFMLYAELGISPTVDTYGEFEEGKMMFVDQGWLIDETEVQLRFYKNPIHLFRASQLLVSLSAHG